MVTLCHEDKLGFDEEIEKYLGGILLRQVKIECPTDGVMQHLLKGHLT